MSEWRHLASRFRGSLSRRPLASGDDAWAQGLLSPAERKLWQRMSLADRKHAAGVARRVQQSLALGGNNEILVAALLHDVGKVDADLGTFGRVLATLAAMAAGRSRVIRGNGRIARYLRHDILGAELLVAAGSTPLVVAWAREHHLSSAHWSVESRVGAVLKAADDD